MISKHVDLIAVGVLLAALGVFSEARQMVVMTLGGPVHYLRMNSGREVHLPAMPRVPEPPRIFLQND